MNVYFKKITNRNLTGIFDKPLKSCNFKNKNKKSCFGTDNFKTCLTETKTKTYNLKTIHTYER